MYGYCCDIGSEENTQYAPGICAQESEEVDDEDEAGNEEEEIYGLFRNVAAKKVWAQLLSMMGGKSSVDGEEDGDGEEEEVAPCHYRFFHLFFRPL